MSLLEFADYVRATGPSRFGVVAGQRDRGNQPYQPKRDFYRRFLLAVRQGRQMRNDRAVVREAARNADVRKQGAYAELAQGWLRCVSEFEDTSILPVRTGRWRAAEMAVRVTPHLVLGRPDGQVLAVRLHMKADPMTEPDADVVAWAMRQVSRQLHPDGVCPLVVDVRRARVLRPDPEADGFAAWMHSEAAGYRAMWSMIAA